MTVVVGIVTTIAALIPASDGRATLPEMGQCRLKPNFLPA